MQQGGTGPGAAAERMDEPTRYAPFSLERKSAEPAESVDLENGDTSLLHKAESRLSRRGLYGERRTGVSAEQQGADRVASPTSLSSVPYPV